MKEGEVRMRPLRTIRDPRRGGGDRRCLRTRRAVEHLDGDLSEKKHMFEKITTRV